MAVEKEFSHKDAYFVLVMKTRMSCARPWWQLHGLFEATTSLANQLLNWVVLAQIDVLTDLLGSSSF